MKTSTGVARTAQAIGAVTPIDYLCMNSRPKAIVGKAIGQPVTSLIPRALNGAVPD